MKPSRRVYALFSLLLACGHDAAARQDAGTAGMRVDGGRADASVQPDARVPGSADAGVDAQVTAPTDAATPADATVDASGADAGQGSTAVCKPGAKYGPPLSAASLAAEKISDGLAFTEGPVWVPSQGVLLFSEMLAGTGPDNVQPAKIWQLSPPATIDLWLEASGSNGLALAADGESILAATHDTQSISRFQLVGKARSAVVSTFDGLTFHSPNDLTVRSDGTVYFTDPSFQQGNRNTGITPKTGVYRVGSDGVAHVVDDTLGNPNGIAISPDEKTLYVGSGDGSVRKYAVAGNGSTGPSQPFASGLSAPDGMTVDCAGNLYVTEHLTGLVHVYAASGTKLGTISTSARATNAAFGGNDGRTLFITAGDPAGVGFGLYFIRLDVPGLPH